MKSSFLLFLILGLVSTQAFGQTKKKVTTAPTTTKVAEAPKSSFDKFYERLSIGYFGILTSPPLEKWNSNNASISPDWQDGCRNCDTYSMNLWSQVNFAYNYGGTMKFNVIPRWTTFFDTPSGQPRGQNSFILVEDALVGFSGVILSSPDKKFNWWMRPGVRLPTSVASKHNNNGEFGHLSYQFEVTNSFTYDFNPKWQVGTAFQTRYWIYENRFNHSRNRLYFGPNVTYTVNDTTKVIAYYENILENTRRWKSINGKEPSYRNVFQNAYIGVAKDITPKLNVYPYLSGYVNDVPFSMRSLFVGAWISYSIK